MPSLVINVTIVTFVTKVTSFHMVADVNIFAFVSMKKSIFTHHCIMVIYKSYMFRLPSDGCLTQPKHVAFLNHHNKVLCVD